MCNFMFNACRVPATQRDHVLRYDPAAHDYVVVLRKNRFFALPIRCADGSIASTDQIESCEWYPP